ncbi:MAG: cation transporter [Xanthomonadaceae bacterium]|nr:cation transporter [Xanthomonadaceae bacterium]
MGHHHHHAPALSAQEDARGERYRATRNATLVGSALDLTLGIAKIVVGILAHSQALIADGIHSLSDLGADFMVLYAARGLEVVGRVRVVYE